MINQNLKESLNIKSRCPMAENCVILALDKNKDSCRLHNCVIMINPQTGQSRLTSRDRNYKVNLASACDHV